ncbi:transcriptional regulator, LuxR family [Kribbella flavida DSM 17836]|uniref:Transcriptional regulator, LuxR family n=1 Tax=Kribbella flavida (strain DSM 17836 / JCM 10339 / NBRC 14399) TaxID=479435 RepID=D2Q0B4_KRIFD|nr:SigE family RNA polymerase sigma factor [Kribbella flavida]ADB31906.1 transcriptional regulator, LuxR family [Kribbella flavida DSM 17836]
MTFDEWAPAGLPRLLRFAAVLCGGGDLAEDVVQDVLIKAHRHWDRVRSADQPEAYLRRMVVNEFLSWRRKWSRFVPRPEILPAEPVADHARQQADRDQLIGELAKLPRRQRAVLVLRYYGGQSDQEIADTLGCATSTVRAHASRALAALRIELTNDLSGAHHAH